MKKLHLNIFLTSILAVCAVFTTTTGVLADHIEFAWVDENTIQGSQGNFIRSGSHPNLPYTLNGQGGCPRITIPDRNNLEDGVYVADCSTLEEHAVSVSTANYTPTGPGETPPIIDDEEDSGGGDHEPGDISGSCAKGQVRLGIPIGGQNCIDEGQAIFVYTKGIIRFLSLGVGLVITVMIVIAGIEYTIAGGNTQLIQDAKHKLKNAIGALLLFIFAVALLNYMIPGGIL